MTSYLYKPECPLADSKTGMVAKEDYYLWKSFNSEDKHMMDGNKRVYIGYISDEMEPTRHMARPDKRMYTSKKLFRDETRARGCIEVGNECATLLKSRRPKQLDKRERVEQLKHVINTLKSKQSPRERRKKGVLKHWVGNGNI